MKITNNLEEITVYERKSDYFCSNNPGISLIIDQLIFLNSNQKELYLKSGKLKKKRKQFLFLISKEISRKDFKI